MWQSSDSSAAPRRPPLRLLGARTLAFRPQSSHRADAVDDGCLVACACARVCVCGCSNFYEKNYKVVKMLNPRMPFLIRPAEKAAPYVIARYGALLLPPPLSRSVKGVPLSSLDAF